MYKKIRTNYGTSINIKYSFIYILLTIIVDYLLKAMAKVDIEYCGKCNFEWQCKMLKMYLEQHQPNSQTVCHQGRQGAFEVKVNDILIYSKLQSLAFPDHQSILENVQRVENGLPLIKTKEQPIDDCVIV